MCTQQILRNPKTSRVVYLLLMLGLLLPATMAVAADSITATKTKNVDGTYSTGGTATFTIATAQVIEWEARYTDTPPAGDDFYLHHPGQPLNEIPLSTGLSAFDGGTQFLSAGTYEISVTYYGMGAGSYTINYNRTASIGLAPTTHSFPDVLTGESSANTTFTISSTGDLPVNITSVTVTDPAHFEISGAPTGQTVPPSKTFQVRCNGGVTAGSYGGTITVSGTSDLGAVTTTATVSCDVLPREPDIDCPGTPSLGSADWFTSATLTANRSFSNEGTDDLSLTSITVVNDTAASVFSANGAPSLSPLTPSHSRNVSITFAPPFTGGEATYSGHLVINSNDPDEPVKTCPFTARAHHPVPIMRLESTTLDYRDVELGFTFTQAIVVHNDGDAPLNITVADISAGDPDLVHFNLNTGPSVIAPSDPPAVFRQEFSPQSVGGPYTIQMQVTGNDPANPSQNVTLTGNGIAPVPIDSVLILDRSGSMDDAAGARRKINALQVAADLFTHLLRPNTAGSTTGDKLGFVRYNHNNDVYMPLDFVEETATPGSHLADAEDKLSNAAISDINRLRPDGATGIGGAMQTGAGMLLGSPSDRKQVMVVLTDGRENRTPWIREVIGPITSANPDLMMYSVGLGSNIQADRLQDITNAGPEGYHQVADDLSGTTIFDLESFYFKIFVNATGMDLVVDPTHLAPLSGSVPQNLDWAHVVSSDRSATFLVLDDPALRSLYNLELVDPHGNVIVLGSSVGGVPVHVLQRHNYTLYRVVFPGVEQAASYVGDWVLRLTPTGEWNPTTAKQLMTTHEKVGMVMYDPGQGVAPIGFAAAVASDYRLQVQVLPSSYLPGAEVTLTGALSDRGWPMTKGEIEVDITTPTGTRYNNQRLYDDGTHGDLTAADGTWTGRFIQTAESGSYRFFFHSIGENERGELAPRQATRYATLQVANPDPDEEPCIPCNLQRLLWILLFLLLLALLYCCCWRKHLSRVG